MAMMPPLTVPELGLSESEAQARFERLQERLVPLWQRISRINDSPQTIVVVPSQTIDFDCQGAEMQAYEERMLFMVLLLRQSRARMIYVTSQSILPATVDYYLSLMPGIVNSHALRRFINVAVEDRTPRPLTLKLLERPHVCERIRSLIDDPMNAHMVPFNVTLHERNLALRLGIPLYGADPKFWQLGSKSGSREVFAVVGASYPIGYEELRGYDDVLRSLADLRRQRPTLPNAMVKLNEGVSGEGNAVVDFTGLPAPDSADADAALEARLHDIQFESSAVTFDGFFQKMSELGGIVEERIQGRNFCSPSVQLRVTPLGDAEILSTHDQLLGGPTGQSFLGSQFPASPDYGPLIATEALKIAKRLAELGVLGRFAVDFVVVQDDEDRWRAYAIEINLRKGGTTHPFLILQFLTDGQYDHESGVFRAPSGKAKCYMTSDHLESSLYHAFTPGDLIEILMHHKLHFDQAHQTGILVHMLATVGENGRFGVVAVGDTMDEAKGLYARVQAVVKREAHTALQTRPLPE